MKPYKVNVVEKNYYGFVTAAGIRYACYFLSYKEYFDSYKEISGNVYGFNVEVLKSNSTIILDERTGMTIIEIVKNFLSSLENAVIYVCD